MHCAKKRVVTKVSSCGNVIIHTFCDNHTVNCRKRKGGMRVTEAHMIEKHGGRVKAHIIIPHEQKRAEKKKNGRAFRSFTTFAFTSQEAGIDINDVWRNDES